MTPERTFYGDCRDDAMFGKPFTDAEVERIRALQAARMRFATSPLPVHSATGADGRWLATVDALRGDLRLATTLLDVATDAAAQAVIDAKEVYEERHLGTVKRLRDALEFYARTDIWTFGEDMDGNTWAYADGGAKAREALKETP